MPSTHRILITWEFPRLCRGGSRSLTYTAVVLRKTCDGLRHDVIPAGQQGKASTAEIGDAVGETQSDAFIRDHFSWISSRGADVLWDFSAFLSFELGKCHWPLQAALSGSIIKAPGFAGGYLPASSSDDEAQPERSICQPQ